MTCRWSVTFAEDSAKRIVIVTDGNENLGDARGVAEMLAESGIAFDVLPIRLSARADVALQRVILPSDIRKGQPFEVRVVANNTTPVDKGGRPVPGRLKLFRRTEDITAPIGDPEGIPVTLEPGKKAFSFEDVIDEPDFFTYEARFVPDDAKLDRVQQNNMVSAFTHVHGQGHILLVEDWQHPGEFRTLVNRLRENNIEVTVRPSNRLFESLAQLQRYDSVVLADVPRSAGDSADSVAGFSDAQVQMLVRNTQQMGSGLVMVGGDRSFGAGGWANTELEKAMPVDFQIDNAKVVPVGALVLVMHASEMARGNYWQKIVSREAIKTLGYHDYCGLVHWNDRTWKEGWLWAGDKGGLAKVGPNRDMMLARLDRMTPGDMPEFKPAMEMAYAGFTRVPSASVKHMIMISDGDPAAPPTSTIAKFANFTTEAGVRNPIKISTVAIGSHGAAGTMGNTLQKIATATGGKYYVVKDPRALPRIYQREARRVAQPLIYDKPVQPRINSVGGARVQHEVVRDIADPLPPLTGFVLTTVKDHPLVEVSIVADMPDAFKNNATILAGWTYGLGRTAVFTSDAGKRWATQWTGWENYDKLFSQLVRWSMRPPGDDENFSIITDVRDGRVQVIVTALDKDDEFLNFLDMSAAATDPEMKPFDFAIRQTAPGRYVGEFEVDKSGPYFVTIVPGPGRRPLVAGVDVPYSTEFSDFETNEALLLTITDLTPTGGESGQIIVGSLNNENVNSLLDVDTFRHNLPRAVSIRDIWPLLLVIASCVFFADVFVRRVSINFAWLTPVFEAVNGFILRREKPDAPDERLARLKSKKSEIETGISERKATARFEPEPDEQVDLDALDLDAGVSGAPEEKKRPTTQEVTPEDDQETYTERLLKAKKDVWKKD